MATAATNAVAATQMSVKLCFEDTVRRVALETPLTLKTLQASISKLFQSLETYQLTYCDDEDDVCLIGTEEELAEAVRLAEGKVLRITVEAAKTTNVQDDTHDDNHDDNESASGQDGGWGGWGRGRGRGHGRGRGRGRGGGRWWARGHFGAQLSKGEEEGGRFQWDCSRMPRHRLENVLARKLEQLETLKSKGDTNQTKLDRLNATVKTLTDELASRPEDEEVGGRNRGQWTGPPAGRLPYLPRHCLERIRSKAASRLTGATDAEDRAKLEASIAAIDEELASRPEESEPQPRPVWRRRVRDRALLEKLHDKLLWMRKRRHRVEAAAGPTAAPGFLQREAALEARIKELTAELEAAAGGVVPAPSAPPAYADSGADPTATAAATATEPTTNATTKSGARAAATDDDATTVPPASTPASPQPAEPAARPVVQYPIVGHPGHPARPSPPPTLLSPRQAECAQALEAMGFPAEEAREAAAAADGSVQAAVDLLAS